VKKQLESMSGYYKPKIDKKSEKLVNRSKVIGKETTVFERLYQHNEEIQKRLLQKTIEALPDFRPNINKNAPSYRNNRPRLSNNSIDYLSERAISGLTTTNKGHKHTNSVEITMKFNRPLEKISYNTVTSSISQSDKTHKSKMMNNSSVMDTYSNAIIMSNSDEEEEEDDLIAKYKKALEQSNQKPSPNKNAKKSHKQWNQNKHFNRRKAKNVY